MSGSRVKQLAGVEAVEAALAAGEDVRLLLVSPEPAESGVRRVIETARARGIDVRPASERVLARLSMCEPPASVIALVGRDPAASIEEMVARGGASWLLVGVAYPGNVGMVVRTAEVSGAEGIVVDARFDSEGRKAALRASMRADRFMPVHWAAAAGLLDAAEAAGQTVIAVDESADRAPWDVDLVGPRVFVVGGENGGIPPEVRARCHAAIRVPMAGSIPCYNLQAAVSAVAIERLRQLELRFPGSSAS